MNAVYRCVRCDSVAWSEVHARNRWCTACKRWEADKAPHNPLWETKDGEVMPISQMTDSHLQFSINKILMSNDFRKHMFDPMMLELKRRKELRDRVTDAFLEPQKFENEENSKW